MPARNWLFKLAVPITLIAAMLNGQDAGAGESEPGPTGDSWPREIQLGTFRATFYPPQLVSWDGYSLEALMALSVKEPDEEIPVYGMLRLTALSEVDKDERIVHLTELRVEEVRLPSASDREESYLQLLRNFAASKTRDVPLDRMEAELAILEAEKEIETLDLKNDPPRILFASTPSLLILIDGEPAYQPVEKTRMERIINTLVLVVRDKEGKHYLRLFDGWLEGPSFRGPWQVARKTPKELKKVYKWAEESGRVDLLEGPSDPEGKGEKPSLGGPLLPRIFVETSPTELIVTEGAPQYEQIPETQLAFAVNTTGHLFRHIPTETNWVLVSGRWFRARDLGGPWEYVSGGKLPTDFFNIPDDCPKENVKAAIPGTFQAQEAVVAAMIPQTAQIKIAEAKLTPPEFDGEPELKPIAGTGLQYVVNSPTPIVLSDGIYYAVENGVWFVSSALAGPWVVATSVAPEIYSIPPSNPLHYVTYVRIYKVTEDSVYSGYTAGYTGTLISHGSGAVVVYGTGYYYSPWVRTYWYGPPVTYGFGASVTYTPWTGWVYGYGFGWYYGSSSLTVSWGWGSYPWWGPVGWGWYYPAYYRPVYGYAWGPRGVAAWGPGGWAATTGNMYSRWGDTSAVTRRSGGYNAWTGNRWANQVGMSYNSRTGNLAAGQRAAVGNVYTGNYAYGSRGAVTNTSSGISAAGGRVTVGNARTGESVSAGRIGVTNPNTGQSGSIGGIRGSSGSAVRVGENVFASKDGQVYRRTDSGWQQVDRSGNWNGVQNQSRSRSLDRASTYRSQGAARSMNYRSGSFRSAGGGRRGRR